MHRRFEEAFIPNGHTVAEYEANVLARPWTTPAGVQENLRVLDLRGGDGKGDLNFGSHVPSGQRFARIKEQRMIKGELSFERGGETSSPQMPSIWKMPNLAETHPDASAPDAEARTAHSQATKNSYSTDWDSDAGSNYRSSENNTTGTTDTNSEATHSVFAPTVSEVQNLRGPTRTRLKRKPAATHWYLRPHHGVMYTAENGEPRWHCAYCKSIYD